MASKIADLRREYTLETLSRSSVDPDPIVQFKKWFDEALSAEVMEPNAMTLATVNAQNQPSARIVLLKGFDQAGLVFFTNYRSAKGEQLAHNPRAALVFFWKELERQVRIEGQVSQVSRDESEAYFQTRPRGSQIGALASNQSRVVASRNELEKRFKEIEHRFAEQTIPTPPHWGGYRLAPHSFEFWQGRQSRLHDRIRYRLDNNGWRIERLEP